MKRTIKIALVLVIAILSLSLFGCSLVDGLFNIGEYSFSDIIITQTGIKEFKIDFTVNCGKEDVKIYFTEGFRLNPDKQPEEVKKTVDGAKARFTMTKELALAENYYIWVVNGDRESKTSITAPSMFPSVTTLEDGSGIFNFNYTYGVAWDSFCDPEGKSVYVSSSPVFDDSARLIADKISITEENALIPSTEISKDNYYYAVSSANDGLIKIISAPISLPQNIISEVTDISAKLSSDLKLCVEIKLSEESFIDETNSEYIQLVVKTNTADDVYVVDCTYNDGVATMSFDCTQMIWDGVWYDLSIAWRGAVISEIPQFYNNKQVNGLSSIKKNGVIYNIVGWKPEGAAAYTETLKIYFEDDTTRYADEFCNSYLVSFSVDPEPTLILTLKLKDGQEAPVLAITGGDKTKLASTVGVENADGSYTYSLSLTDVLTEDNKWYDIRLFFGNVACELLKDSCITYKDFSAKYTHSAGGKVYEFREYNGMLKIMYTNL